MKKSTKHFFGLLFPALLLAAPLTLAGCSGNGEENTPPASSPPQETASAPMEEEDASQETAAAEETVDPETMDLIKYNIYVEMNNYIVEILHNLDSYYLVVADDEEFSLLQDSGYSYKYDISPLNSDIIDDALAVAELEPDYGALDQLTLDIAEPMRVLMDTFSDIYSSNDFADNQYAKAREFHTEIRDNAAAFEDLAYQYIDAVSAEGAERIAEEEARMLEEGRLIIYNASHAITTAQALLNECYRQGVYDDNITELDLTAVRPLYEELTATVDAYNAAVQDTNQLVTESLSGSPMYGLLDSLVQAVDWMIQQVESGSPIPDPGSEYLGGIIHIEVVLSDCIDQYNSAFVE